MLVQFGMWHRAACDDTLIVPKHDTVFPKWNTQVMEDQVKVDKGVANCIV